MEYTVKEIADILEISKPTVQTKINNLDIKPAYKEYQANYYSENACKIIIAEVDKTADVDNVLQRLSARKQQRQAPPKESDIKQGVEKFGANDRQTPPNTDNLAMAAMQETISFLKEQLQTKDAQIEKMQLLLAQQQQITLSIDKKEEPAEKEEPKEESKNENEKQGFFNYIKDYFKK